MESKPSVGFWSGVGGEIKSAASSFWNFATSPIQSTVGVVAKDSGAAIGDVLSGFTPTLVLLIVLGVVVFLILGRAGR